MLFRSRFETAYADGFKSIGWVGFMAMAREPVVFYVDNFVLEPVTDRRPSKGN